MSPKVLRLVFFAFLLLCPLFLIWNALSAQNYIHLRALLFVLLLMTLLWLWSLYLKDSSIVDIFWGAGFVIMAWFYLFSLPFPGLLNFKNLLFCSLVSLWGFRLAWHIGNRNIGKGEDFRYRKFREQGGKNYWWISYLRVFVMQGVLLWVISSFFALQNDAASFSLFEYAGILLWTLGFFFEAVGDWQLKQFKKSPENKGKLMDKGLWRYTRHPNYFGDAVVWWGLYAFFLPVQQSWMFVFAPLMMTFLLRYISGVALLEKTLVKTKPTYQEYMQKTSAFFPWWPRK